jgi:hypothetical protein
VCVNPTGRTGGGEMKDVENCTDKNWETELAVAYSKLGLKQKKALNAYFKYHKNMETVMRKFLAGDIKSMENAFLLIDSFFSDVLQKTVYTPSATDGLTIGYESICELSNYYKCVIKYAAERNAQTPESAAQAFPSFVYAIEGYYPLFIKHYPKLKEKEFIEPKELGLHWKKSKQSLAEYFDAIKPEGKKHNWRILESIFGESDLRQAASQNGNEFKGKKSKDFDELTKIITLP